MSNPVPQLPPCYALAVGLCVIVGCSGGDGDAGTRSSSGGAASAADDGTGARLGGTGAFDTALPDAGDDDPWLSTGTRDAGGGRIVGCEKVDFLFVIDGSGSMLEHQAELARSFPIFIHEIEDVLQVTDFHIMVVDTDAQPQDCYDSCFGGITRCNGAACAGLPRPGSCEATLGGGRVTDLEGQPCGVVGGRPYLTSDQPELASTFRCMATIGGGQLTETPMAAMLAALDAEANASGGCNEGFLRPDAILVVVIITDEADRGSAGGPEDWRKALIGVKGGDASAVAVLGITAGDDALNSFVDGFMYGQREWISRPDYSGFLVQTVDDLDSSCETFEVVLQ